MASGAPVLIAAEVGINHNGDLELAKRSIRAAAESGADAVKFQNYATEDFVSDRTLTYTYNSGGRSVTESQWEMFKRYEFRREWWPEISRECAEAGMLMFSTPTSASGVDDCIKAGAPLLKNGSDYLTDIELLAYMGTTGVPVVVSTGMADARDVDAAVEAVRRAGRSEVILLHCTSAYPTAPADTNLRRMLSLRDRYQVPVGFSDHTEGHEAAVQAVSMGACFIEKHFTLDHGLPGPDHWFSSTPEEFRTLVTAVRRAEDRMGSAAIAPAKAEEATRNVYRVGVVAAHALPAGSELRRESVSFRRPGRGLLPQDLSKHLGRKLRRDLILGEPVTEGDLRD